MSSQDATVDVQIFAGVDTLKGTTSLLYAQAETQATSSVYASPASILIDTIGLMFIADFEMNTIRGVAPDGTPYVTAG